MLRFINLNTHPGSIRMILKLISSYMIYTSAENVVSFNKKSFFFIRNLAKLFIITVLILITDNYKEKSWCLYFDLFYVVRIKFQIIFQLGHFPTILVNINSLSSMWWKLHRIDLLCCTFRLYTIDIYFYSVTRS